MTPSHPPAGPDLVDLPLACRCGAVRGVVHAIPRGRTNRSVCLCDDCQAYAHFLGRATEVLDANGGTDIVPVAPRHLELTQGREHVRCVRLTSSGMYRWYAGCCNTPIANTPALRRLPFAGMVHTIVEPHVLAPDEREALRPRCGPQPTSP